MSDSNVPKILLTVDELSEATSIGTNTIYALCNTNQIAYIRIKTGEARDGTIRIPVSETVRLLDELARDHTTLEVKREAGR